VLTGALWVAAGAAGLGCSLAWWRRTQPVLARSGAAIVPVPPTECYEEIARVVAAWPAARSVEHVPHVAGVEFRTHASMGGFGERVTVRATEAESGSLVTVSSSPAFWATVVDYGRNRRNVRAVLDGVLARCGGTVVDQSAHEG
jgi:hypothetical protein